MSALNRKPAARRVFMCTECHKGFRGRDELYLHAEQCLLEAFEHEAKSMLSDMPDLGQSGTNATGITVSSEGLTTGQPPPLLEAEKRSNSGRKGNFEVFGSTGIEGDDQEIRKPVSYGNTSTAAMEGARTIEGKGGLKLVISVERPDDYISTDLDAFDLDELDEDVSIPAAGGKSALRPGEPGFRVMGALANADDDTYKPKMECPTCGLVLYRHNFSTHYRIHTGEMPFLCGYCDKRFRTTSALKVHTRAHTGEKPYVCSRCNYACITKRNLDRHIINNHVREGMRRGPRYRRSRYRLSDPHHEEYLLELARTQGDDLDDMEDEEEATYMVIAEGDDSIDVDSQQVIVDDGEEVDKEDLIDQRPSGSKATIVVQNEDLHY